MENLPKKVRSKKLSTKVDLTAMVSVSFLLIIFFMVTIELAKPKVLEYRTSSDCDDCFETSACNMPDENRSMTILLDGNNKMITYCGLLAFPIDAPKEVKYGKNGIRQQLLERSRKVYEYSAARGRPGRGVTVIIKPGKNSNYGNLVEILDEMKITGINSYSVVDYYSPEEAKLLASK
jgi:biopolymer transport protein ExbD